MAKSAKNSNGTERRLYIFGGLMLLWALAIGARLVDLQVVHYGDFEQRAQRQQQRTFEISPRRGVIYDRNGNELAMSVNVNSAFAVPSEVPDLEQMVRLVSRITGVDAGEVLAHCKAQRAFCWVARKLDPDTAERVKALNLKGIYFQKEPKRFYPKRELGAQVLGYVGLDDEGLSGIEREFDEQLRGTPGKMMIQRDARGQYFNRAEHQPEPGENIVLTLDERIQYVAERELEQAMQETKAISGTVIVQNPHTGEILALANRPTFNPNQARGIRPEQLKNHAVSDVYEPGSTFKIVTVAGALEEHVTRPDEVIDCQMGSIVVGGMRIRDHKAYGNLTVEQIIQNSSDVGAIKLGLRLGEKRFDQYIRGFGFGSQSGIELPGETRGLTKPVSRWSKVSIGAISMGQEIGISAVQLAGLISTIANQGMYAPPRILMSNGPGPATNSSEGGAVVRASFHPADGKRVISPETAAAMKKMLQMVVEHGTGFPKALLDGYSAAGKTGTAQRVDPATGAYSKTKYIASFAGFAPVGNPAVTIVVILDSAVGLHQGGQVAAPVFRRIAQQVLPYLNVAHDLDLTPNDARRKLLLAKVTNEDMEEGSPDRLGEALGADESVQAQLRQPEPVTPRMESKPSQRAAVVPASLKMSAEKAAKTVASPALPEAARAEVQTPAHGTVVLDVGNSVEVPSFVGQPVRSVIELAQQQGLEVDVAGSGVARDQSPAAGTRVSAGSHVAVRFGR
jgi:cell division protein FtsI (penicillin-binding protein 3)